jgi:hypothetical protein
VAISIASNKKFQCNLFSGPSNSNCLLANNCTACPFGLVKASIPGQCNKTAPITSCPRPSNNNGINYGVCPSFILKNSTCNAGCLSGYSVNGSLLVSCDNLGNITLPIGNCLPKPCNVLPSFFSGKTVGDCTVPVPHSTTCNLGCDSTHTLFGSLSTTCSFGNWTSVTGVCNSNCASLPTVSNVSIYTEAGTCTTNFPSGSSCILSCASGFIYLFVFFLSSY